MKTVRIYISGPIAHYDLDERISTFAQMQDGIETTCRNSGLNVLVVNPFCNGISQSKPWQEHMRADLKMLLSCDVIYMMHGWEHSKGCKLELDVASSTGISVVVGDTDGLIDKVFYASEQP